MNTKTVLTEAEIIAIGHQARAIESGEKGYILPIAFARAIEQAVLQSTEIQALRKDAERYRYMKKGGGWIVAATQTGWHVDGEELDDLIDNEMEQKNDQ